MFLGHFCSKDRRILCGAIEIVKQFMEFLLKLRQLILLYHNGVL